jgi:hypothetical protein
MAIKCLHEEKRNMLGKQTKFIYRGTRKRIINYAQIEEE